MKILYVLLTSCAAWCALSVNVHANTSAPLLQTHAVYEGNGTHTMHGKTYEVAIIMEKIADTEGKEEMALAAEKYTFITEKYTLDGKTEESKYIFADQGQDTYHILNDFGKIGYGYCVATATAGQKLCHDEITLMGVHGERTMLIDTIQGTLHRYGSGVDQDGKVQVFQETLQKTT
ncbi:MAG: hypothetical protein OXT67_00750 [Zetaproteobacteria bacterium]|nr:hypothetical protein [Zetaproteobacteria bacterium]